MTMQLIWGFAVVVLVLLLGVAIIVASTRYGWPVPRAIGWVLVVVIGMMALSVGAVSLADSGLFPWLIPWGLLLGPVVALVVGLALIISHRHRQSPHTITVATVLLVLGLLGVFCFIAFLVSMVGIL